MRLADAQRQLAEAQRAMLPEAARGDDRVFHVMPGDGSCFFHCARRVIDATEEEMRLVAECPHGWADEPHIRRLAAHYQVHFSFWPIELEAWNLGVQIPMRRRIGPRRGRHCHLVHWTRGGAGLHFDLIAQTAPDDPVPPAAASFP